MNDRSNQPDEGEERKNDNRANIVLLHKRQPRKPEIPDPEPPPDNAA